MCSLFYPLYCFITPACPFFIRFFLFLFSLMCPFNTFLHSNGIKNAVIDRGLAPLIQSSHTKLVILKSQIHLRKLK